MLSFSWRFQQVREQQQVRTAPPLRPYDIRAVAITENPLPRADCVELSTAAPYRGHAVVLNPGEDDEVTIASATPPSRGWAAYDKSHFPAWARRHSRSPQAFLDDFGKRILRQMPNVEGLSWNDRAEAAMRKVLVDYAGELPSENVEDRERVTKAIEALTFPVAVKKELREQCAAQADAQREQHALQARRLAIRSAKIGGGLAISGVGSIAFTTLTVIFGSQARRTAIESGAQASIRSAESSLMCGVSSIASMTGFGLSSHFLRGSITKARNAYASAAAYRAVAEAYRATTEL